MSPSKSASASPSPSGGEEEVPCNLTLAEIRARVLADLDDTDPGTYWTDDEVDHAINMAHRLWCLLTLCLERTVTFNLTVGQAFYEISDQISDFHVVLRASFSGLRLRADTLHNLDLRSKSWRQTAGSPTRYAQHGFDLLAITPQPASGTPTLALTYAAEPAELVNDSDVPEIAPDQQVHLEECAFWLCRAKEGSQELANAQMKLDSYFEAAQKYSEFTRARSKAQSYDKYPMDIETFEEGRRLLKTLNQTRKGPRKPNA